MNYSPTPWGLVSHLSTYKFPRMPHVSPGWGGGWGFPVTSALADCLIEPNETVDWVAVYRKPFECTKISKLLVFQFKRFHRRLATNNFLKKINFIDNDPCSFCQREDESLIHLFWTCTVTSRFWEAFKEWLIRDKVFPMLDLSPTLVVGLKPQLMQNKNHYFLFLVARYYIWTCRTRSHCPKIEGFHPFLSHYNPTTCN